MTCAEVPHRTHATVLLPFLRLGKLKAAERSYRAGYKMIRENPDFIGPKSYHLAYLALTGNLARHLHGVTLPKGFTSADVTPAVLSHLPAVVHQGFVAGYAESIQTVFLVAVPIAALAFLATWLIPQVELKRWPEATEVWPGPEPTMASVTVAPEAQEAVSPAEARQAISPSSRDGDPA